jgi:protocatechuate 3,4-dioxygenase, beta subunit
LRCREKGISVNDRSFGYQPYPPGTQPPYRYPAYKSTIARAPRHAPITIPQTLSEVTGPTYAAEKIWEGAADLTRQVKGGEAIGQRLIVHGQVSDDRGRPVRNTLVEVWQANTAGRYVHSVDQHDAPLDPFFIGRGAVVTDGDGFYEFLTIEPGAYPWANHHNAWRPKHIHFSLFGYAQASRLVTQMYFPGDNLLPLDPVFNSVPDEVARERLVANFDMAKAVPEYALAYRFDIVVRGPRQTPFERQCSAAT